jgi:TIR domain
MPVVVISYRRADSTDMARRICGELASRYGKDRVYIDVDSILPSADYRIHIRHALERALVMLSVIGTEWSGPRTNGTARIFDPDDPVRIEVETALANRRPILPVLVNGAHMPTESEVPGSLDQFHYLHAITVGSGDTFSSDINRLFRAIDQLTARFWTVYASAYLALPLVMVLVSQYLILFKLDTDPLYLRFAVAAISAALGSGLCFGIGFRTIGALTTAGAVGLTAAVGMLAINALLSNPAAPLGISDFIPSVARDWQEVVEYFANITFVTLAANLLAWMVRDRRS